MFEGHDSVHKFDHRKPYEEQEIFSSSSKDLLYVDDDGLEEYFMQDVHKRPRDLSTSEESLAEYTDTDLILPVGKAKYY